MFHSVKEENIKQENFDLGIGFWLESSVYANIRSSAIQFFTFEYGNIFFRI